MPNIQDIINSIDKAIWRVQGSQVNNITPFTYRDGLTYLEVLERIRGSVVETIDYVGKFGEEQKKIIATLNDKISTFITEMEKTHDGWNKEIEAKRTDMLAAIKAMQDKVVTATFTRSADGRTITAPLAGGGTVDVATKAWGDQAFGELKTEVSKNIADGKREIDSAIAENLKQGIDIIAVYGQSNAAGSGYPVTEFDQGDSRILAYYAEGSATVDGRFDIARDPLTAGFSESYGVGPAIAFAKRMIANEQLSPGRKYLIVNRAWGGANSDSLAGWVGEFKKHLSTAINKAGAQGTVRISHLLYVQGEADAVSRGGGAKWTQNTNTIINTIKTLPEAANMKVLIGSIPPDWAEIAPGGNDIIQAQKAMDNGNTVLWVAGPYGHTHDVDGIDGNQQVGIHYSARGARALGQAMADRASGKAQGTIVGYKNGRLYWQTPLNVTRTQTWRPDRGWADSAPGESIPNDFTNSVMVSFLIDNQWSASTDKVYVSGVENTSEWIMSPLWDSNFNGYPMNGWGGAKYNANARVHGLGSNYVPIQNRNITGGAALYTGGEVSNVSATNDWSYTKPAATHFINNGFTLALMFTPDVVAGEIDPIGWREQGGGQYFRVKCQGNNCFVEVFANGEESVKTATFTNLLRGAPNFLVVRRNAGGAAITLNSETKNVSVSGFDSKPAAFLVGDGYAKSDNSLYAPYKGTIDYVGWWKYDIGQAQANNLKSYIDKTYRWRRAPELSR